MKPYACTSLRVILKGKWPTPRAHPVLHAAFKGRHRGQKRLRKVDDAKFETAVGSVLRMFVEVLTDSVRLQRPAQHDISVWEEPS